MPITYYYEKLNEDFYFILPEFYLWSTAIALLSYMILITGRYMHFYFFRTALLFVLLILFFTFVILVAMYYFNYLLFFSDFLQKNNFIGSIQTKCLNEYLVFDQFTLFFKIFVIFLTFVTVLASFDYFKIHVIRAFEYPILILFVTLGSLLLISSLDLIGFYLTMEFISFCLYTLASSRYKSIYSAEASIKYFVHGCCVSGLYVFGTSLFFLSTGTTNFYSVATAVFNGVEYGKLEHELADAYVSGVSIFFIAAVLTSILPLFKVAVVPYHYWIADVYEGSPMYVTAYFSIVTKFVMVIALIRFFFSVLPIFLFHLSEVFLFYGLVSVIVGVLAALTEQKIKRVLAYSSISHSGYIILGLMPYNFGGLIASLDYIIIYAFTNVIIFIFLLACLSTVPGQYKKHIIFVSDLCLLQRQNYLAASCFAIALLSFAGLPPFAGFFVKFNIFTMLWNSGYTVCVVILIIMNLISTYYYLRFIKCLFFSPNNFAVHNLFISPTNYFVMLIFTSFLIFYPFYGVYLDFFLSHLLLNIFFCDF
jgi:NADH-quinone oxidoreductase subunit N